MSEETTNADQTHCPSCGIHKMAVGTFITQPDDSWKCVRCTQRDKVITPPGQQMVAVTCPTCSGADRACATCSGLGKVRVPMSQLNPYDPAGQQVLTEG